MLLVIPISSALNANGFYVGGSAGASLSSNNNIKVSNLNQQTTYQQTITNHSDDTIYQENRSATRIIQDAATVSDYTSILKEISYSDFTIAPIIGLNIGYAFKNLRFESELKYTILKIKPKSSIYDVILQKNYSEIISAYCSAYQGSLMTPCRSGGLPNGTQVDPSDSNYANCPTSESATISECWLKITNISEENSYNFDNITINHSGSPMFSADVDSAIFSTANINSNNILVFANFIYELALSKNIAIYNGIGLGYGIASIESRQITYPAYQYKAGIYYSLTSNTDITLNYSNINMIGKVQKANLSVADYNIQSVELGIRYNFSSRSPTFFEDYNYRKIFSLPLLKK